MIAENSRDSVFHQLPTTSIIEQKLPLKDSLAKWAVKHKVDRVALSDLLKIIKKIEPKDIEEIPLDFRSLLKTPRSISIEYLSPGHQIYIGLEKNLKRLLETVMDIPSILLIDINIDGSPVYKNSYQFGTIWPILGHISNMKNSPVFAISIFGGAAKPENFFDFLKPFVDEYLDMRNNFTFKGIKIDVKLNNIILDAPARSAVCGIAGHTGYCSCPRCHLIAENYLSRRIFTELDAPLRTNEEFRAKIHKNHNIKDSAFELVDDIDMISNFPIDYLHNVLLGIVKKLLDLWFGQKGLYPPSIKKKVSDMIGNLSKYEPIEFNRRLRSLDKLGLWKGKEFRTFLLYIGPSALKNIISVLHYNNFMLLHCTITILIREEYCKKYNSVSKLLIRTFIEEFEDLYGKVNMTYNIHLLSHLPDDCMNNGPLDNFSAFKFESFLGTLKNFVKSPYKPIQQIYNRILESFKINLKENSDSLSKIKVLYPIDQDSDLYRRIKIYDHVLDVSSDKDSFVQTRDNKILKITKISLKNGKVVLDGKKMNNLQNEYSLPIESKKLGIYRADLNDYSEDSYEINDITRKMFLVPSFENSSISLYAMSRFENLMQ